MSLVRPAGRFPDFICIGVPKAGTTWLDRHLRSHPDLWLPPEKELHYFNLKLDWAAQSRLRLFRQRLRDERWRYRLRVRAREYRRKFSGRYVAWDLRYFFGRPDDRWYASLFAPARDRVCGEITPAYVALPPERIAHVHRLMPDAKLLFCLRNPIERAWSHAIMDVVRAEGADPPPERLVEHFEGTMSRTRTDYLGALDRWTSVYPSDQVFVAFMEDVQLHPRELLERVHAFLGVRNRPPAKDPGRRVHAGSAETIPLALAAYLSELHGDLIRGLASRLGGYADWWAYAAERIRADADAGGTGDLVYPLHDGPYWRDWVRSSGEPALRSGVLPQVERRPALAQERVS